MPKSGDGDDSGEGGRPRRGGAVPPWAAYAVLLFVFVAALGAGLDAFRVFDSRLQSEVEQEITTHATLRAREIERWLSERRGDVGLFTRQSWDRIERDGTPYPDAASLANEVFQTRVANLRNTFVEYTRVAIVDEAGHVVWSEDGSPRAPPGLEAALRTARETGSVPVLGVYEVEGVSPAVAFVSAIGGQVTRDGRVVPSAGLVFEVDPYHSLFAITSYWAGARPSNESFMVRLDGADWVALSPLRFVADATLRLRRPLKESGVPPSGIRPAEPAVTRVTDYRGVEVIRAIERLQTVDWIVVAKVDADEVRAPLRRFGFTIAGLLGLLVSALGFGVLQLRRASALEAAQADRRAQEAEAQVWESAETLRRLAAQLPGVVYQYRAHADGRSSFPYASEALQRIYEVEPAEVREDASKVFARLHPDDLDRVVATIQRSQETLGVWRDEFRVRLPSAGERWVRGEATPERLPDGSTLWHGYIADITEQHRLGERLRSYLEATPLPIHVIDRAKQKTTYLNDAHIRFFGYRLDEIPDADAWFERAYADPELRRGIRASWERQTAAMKPGEASISSPDLQLRCADGSLRWVQGTSSVTEHEQIIVWADLDARHTAAALHALESSRKQAALAILEQGGADRGELLEVALEQACTLIAAPRGLAYGLHTDGFTLQGSRGFEESVAPKVVPAEAAGLLARAAALRGAQEGLAPEDAGAFASLLASGERLLAFPVGDHDIVRFVLLLSGRPTPFGPEEHESLRILGTQLSLAMLRAQAEKELRTSEARFRSLVEQAVVGIVVVAAGRITYTNKRFAELLGRTVEQVIGSRPETFVVPQDVARIEQIRQEQAKGVRAQSSTMTGLHADGSQLTLSVHAVFSLQDGQPATVVLVEDVTERQRAQARIAEYAKELEDAVAGTVKVISRIVELRDPYTAAHERRVAALASAIGRELGWSEDRVYGLEVIASVHDIGQISIPAEILSRSSKLSAVERSMVEMHAEAGRDTLLGIRTRWPIAEAVWQHHERLDGSGYPRKLKGDAIIPEARILAVADVLEAMCSHRPYRAAKGLDAALEEVVGFAGTKYDAEAVQAALRLFRERGFKFPD